MRSIQSIIAFLLLAGSAEAFAPSRSTQVARPDTSLSAASTWKSAVAAGLVVCATTFLSPPPAAADSSRVIGQIAGSGIVFKDTLQVESFEDPKIKGVHLYISTFQRPLNERLSSAKNFFSDPSSSAVACAKTTNKVQIADNINKSPGGEEVFQESKSLLFKSLRVQRVYDTETNTVVYVSFNTRLDKGDDSNKSRFQNALCAVNLNDSPSVSSSSNAEAATATSAAP